MRRIAYWALTNNFKPEGVSWLMRKKEDGIMVGPDVNFPVAELEYDIKENKEGVTVETYEYEKNNNGEPDIVKSELSYPWEKTPGEYPDAGYPVDVKLSNDAEYYGEHDFRGEYKGINFVPGGGGGGTEYWGYLKGYGYVAYTSEFSGYRFTIGANGGTMTGSYVGPGIATPLTLEGSGTQRSVSMGPFEYGTWIGNDSSGNVTWKGEMGGLSVGIDLPFIGGGGAVVNTFSILVYPIPQSNDAK